MAGFFRFGDGSNTNPYLIENAKDLSKIDLVGKRGVYQYFLQINDIDMAGVDHEPIGGTNGPPFSGEYDGGCLEIKNFRSDKGGLFNVVAEGKMKNINIPDAIVNGAPGSAIGTIAGKVFDGDIEFYNCHVSGKVSGGDYCGMFSGMCSYGAVFENCTSSGVINSLYNAGGLFARGSSGDVYIKNCSFKGSIFSPSGGNGDVGGFFSASYEKTFIENSFVEAEIFCDSVAGGLMARANNSLITNCYFKGSINCQYFAGGLIGECRDSVIKNSYAVAEVEAAASYAGGVVASSANNQFERCFFTGKVKARETFAGGFVGSSENGIFESCYSLLSEMAKGWGHTGGFIGKSDHDNCLDCFSIGGSRATTSADDYGGTYAGGFVGYLGNGIMKNCFSLGNALADGAFAGGFTASLNGSSQLTNCYSRGSVAADTWAGGFVGMASYSGGCFMSNCVSAGLVSGKEFVAGFANSSNYIYLDCYSLVDSVTVLPGRNGIWSGDFVDMAYNSSPTPNYDRAYRYNGTVYNLEGTQFFELRGIPTSDRPIDPEGFSLDAFSLIFDVLTCPTRSAGACNKIKINNLIRW